MLDYNFGNVILLNNCLICYSKNTLPFETHTDNVKSYKENIRKYIEELKVDTDKVLVSEYYAPNDNFSDIENKLFYNIGMSAFETLMKNGVLFRRISLEEMNSIIGRITNEINRLSNYYINMYRIISKEEAKLIFKNCHKNLVAKNSSNLTIDFSEATAQNFYEMLRKQNEKIIVNQQLNNEMRFSMLIEIGTCDLKKKFHNIIKPMLDGIICGCHEEDDSKIIKERLNSLAGTDLIKMNKYPLWKKNYIREQNNKWNPADDYLDCAYIMTNDKERTKMLKLEIYS